MDHFRRIVSTALMGLALLAAAPAAARAQEPWDSPRALELVERARERRQAPLLDEALRNYRADVAGHIYFFVDRPDEPEPILLRADQVALDLYWGYPDRTKQVIRGMRHEEQFPIRDFHYYLDRYTVIHDGFGDEIQVGEGRDVRNVPHPLAPGAGTVYEYRLVDSTAIRLPGADEPIRVYEIQVRPLDLNQPAIVGSLFVEQARADLVRLAFTFTRSAYLDRRNERVEVMLENGLWDGRYWLPREQRLLVRRELPEFDFGVGTVIRAALQVTDYDLNAALPDGFFAGPPIVLGSSRAGLRAYDFPTGLYDGFEAVGLAPGQVPTTLGEVDLDVVAGRILREQYLSGISPVRFYVPGASHVLRFSRGEGLVTGAGLSFGMGRSQVVAYGAHAWGSERPIVSIGWRPVGPGAQPRPVAEAYLNRPVGLGLRTPAAGIVSTVAALFGNDHRDTYPASGIAAGFRAGDAATGTLRVALTGESHRRPVQAQRSAPWSDDAFRPVPPASPGERYFVDARYERRFRAGPFSAIARPGIEVGYADFDVEDGAFGRARVDLGAVWSAADLDAGIEIRTTGAAALGATPDQHLWYVGGRNTLPGHPFHAYAGDRAAVLDVTAWREVIPNRVRLRLLAAAGWTALDNAPPVPPADDGLALWEPGPTDGIRASVGLGLGLAHGILRLDYAIRTDTGRGAFIVSIDPRLWGFL